MTPEQYDAWNSLVNTCKGNYQKSINVGSDKMRAVIIAVAALLDASCKCGDWELPEHNRHCPRWHGEDAGVTFVIEGKE